MSYAECTRCGALGIRCDHPGDVFDDEIVFFGVEEVIAADNGVYCGGCWRIVADELVDVEAA